MLRSHGTRLDDEHIMKAIDGLKQQGYKQDQLDNISSIIRLTFSYGLMFLYPNIQKAASAESTSWMRKKYPTEEGD